MDQSEYEDYFIALATSHEDIQHTVDDRKAFVRTNGLSMPYDFMAADDQLIFAFENPESSINPVPDNRLDIKSGGFSILKRCTANDIENIVPFITECEAVCKQFVAKIFDDSLKFQTIKEFPLSKVILIALYPDDSIYPGWVGYRAAFEIRASEPNNYVNPDKWL